MQQVHIVFIRRIGWIANMTQELNVRREAGHTVPCHVPNAVEAVGWVAKGRTILEVLHAPTLGVKDDGVEINAPVRWVTEHEPRWSFVVEEDKALRLEDRLRLLRVRQGDDDIKIIVRAGLFAD